MKLFRNGSGEQSVTPFQNSEGNPRFGWQIRTQPNIGGAFDVGTVFKVDATGKETVLYSFTGGADGQNPYFVVLLRDKAGNLYGTTSEGAGTGCGGNGCGTVFKLTPRFLRENSFHR